MVRTNGYPEEPRFPRGLSLSDRTDAFVYGGCHSLFEAAAPVAVDHGVLDLGSNPFWGPFIVVVVICLLVTVVSPCPVEREVRLIGMVLQLLGVVTIVMRLRSTQRQFPGQMLKLWWLGRPQFRVRDRVVSAPGTVTSVATVSASR